MDLVNNYTCTCRSGYTSYNCEVEIDECISDPCLNGGTCFDLVDRFYCLCAFPYKVITLCLFFNKVPRPGDS